MRRLLLLLPLALAATAANAAEPTPAGPFADAECVACHERESAAVVIDWKDGAHRTSGCTTCHGDRHDMASIRARRDDACLSCHGGTAGPLGRSHLTSKHGVIVAIESPRWDWTRPLADGAYRAPTCAYCHLHQGGHGRVDAKTACLDCHSPRFAETMAQAADRTVALGALKVREGEAAAASVPDTSQLEPLLARLRASQAALRAGAAHGSPDFQWWYGQAALDGDLLRIKDAVTRQRRESTVNTQGASP